MKRFWDWAKVYYGKMKTWQRCLTAALGFVWFGSALVTVGAPGPLILAAFGSAVVMTVTTIGTAAV